VELERACHCVSDRSVRAIQFYFRLVAVHDRYYLMVCTARTLKGAPVVIRLVSRFNRDKEHRDAASRASPRTKRSLFSSKAASRRHRYSPTSSKLVAHSGTVETVSSRRSIWQRKDLYNVWSIARVAARVRVGPEGRASCAMMHHPVVLHSRFLRNDEFRL
jgi:hypothetical protein